MNGNAKFFVSGLFLFLILLVRGTIFLNSCRANNGLIYLSRALLNHSDVVSGEYPHYSTLDDVTLDKFLFYVKDKDENNLATSWTFARLALARGDYKAAADALDEFTEKTFDNPFLYLDALFSFSYDGRYHEVIALQNLYPTFSFSVPIVEAIENIYALAYLQLFENRFPEYNKEQLGIVVELRPDDLYANYMLWKIAKDSGDFVAASNYRRKLTQFSFAATHPVDKRFFYYLAEIIPNLISEGIWSKEQALNVVVSIMLDPITLKDSGTILKKLVDEYPDDADWYFYLGDFYYKSGRFEQAFISYQRALEADSEYIEAYIQLGNLERTKCKSEISHCHLRAIDWYEQAKQFDPDNVYILGELLRTYESLGDSFEESTLKLEVEWFRTLVRNGPDMRVDSQLGNGWVFLGYNVDEDRLIRGETVPIILFWKGQIGENAGSRDEGWYYLGDGTWVQFIEDKKNLVFNGGFELGLNADSPAGFPRDNYLADKSTRRIIKVEQDQRVSTVALLSNDYDNLRTSFVTEQLPVSSDVTYVQAGWIYSVEGNGFIGRNWILNDKSFEVTYEYVVAGSQISNWHHYADIAIPIPGTEDVEIWLLNFNSTGQVYFDNIVFFEVDTPGG